MVEELRGNISDILQKLPEDHRDKKFIRGIRDITDAYMLNKKNLTTSNPLNASIDALQLTFVVHWNLKHQGFTTIEDIDNLSDAELLSLDKIGKKKLRQIRERIEVFKRTHLADDAQNRT